MIEKKNRPVLTNTPLLRFLSDCVHMKLFETQSKDTGQRPPLCCNFSPLDSLDRRASGSAPDYCVLCVSRVQKKNRYCTFLFLDMAPQSEKINIINMIKIH